MQTSTHLQEVHRWGKKKTHKQTTPQQKQKAKHNDLMLFNPSRHKANLIMEASKSVQKHSTERSLLAEVIPN